MKKIFLILLMLIFVVSCDLEDARTAYDKGEYLKSIELVFNYYETNPKKISKIKPEIKNEIMEKFLNITNHYKEMAGSKDLKERQEGYENLAKIYALFDIYKSSSNFSDFQQKYPLWETLNSIEKVIRERLNNNRYSETTNFNEITYDINSYYGNILKFLEKMEENNKISDEAASKYKKMHMIMLRNIAGRFLTLAKYNEEKKEYRNAQNFYELVARYQALGGENATQAVTKSEELKEKADLDSAEYNYKRGLEKIKNAKTKSDYRMAVYYFEDADKYVSNYKDTKNLISKYEDKGYISYSLSGCSGNFIEEYLERKLNFFGKVSSSPEVKITCKTDGDYNISTYPNEVKNMRETREFTNKEGEKIKKMFVFQENKSKSVEKYNYSYTVSISGVVNKTYSGKIVEKNEINSLQYTGDMPKEYENKDKIEKPLGEEKMRSKILENSEFKRAMDAIVEMLENL